MTRGHEGRTSVHEYEAEESSCLSPQLPYRFSRRMKIYAAEKHHTTTFTHCAFLLDPLRVLACFTFFLIGYMEITWWTLHELQHK